MLWLCIYAIVSKQIMLLSGKLKDLMVLAHSIKSKNVINLCNHVDDFGKASECHLFVTSHGKGVCDDIGEESQW
jgi:hypothetical protein